MPKRLPLNRRQLEGIAGSILKCLKISQEWSISVTFMDDRQIRILNKKYLGHNKATDVLAFDYSENTADIAISLETAQKNAAFYKNTYKNELILYIIHGFLHIFGYDDTTEKTKKRMDKKQEELFEKVRDGSRIENRP